MSLQHSLLLVQQGQFISESFSVAAKLIDILALLANSVYSLFCAFTVPIWATSWWIDATTKGSHASGRLRMLPKLIYLLLWPARIVLAVFRHCLVMLFCFLGTLAICVNLPLFVFALRSHTTVWSLLSLASWFFCRCFQPGQLNLRAQPHPK